MNTKIALTLMRAIPLTLRRDIPTFEPRQFWWITSLYDTHKLFLFGNHERNKAQITKSVICNTNVKYRRRASRILFIMYAHNPKIGKSNNRVGKPKCINRIFQISQGYQCSYLTFKEEILTNGLIIII